nr:MAG TPA: hypothetical protein [Bacteriophage sp.]
MEIFLPRVKINYATIYLEKLNSLEQMQLSFRELRIIKLLTRMLHLSSILLLLLQCL